MKKSNKLLALLLVLVLATSLLFVFAGCDPKDDGEKDNVVTPEAKVVRISSTSSVRDSGLMQFLLPYFTADTGWTWELAAAATGAAIASAKAGNADVILVHSQSQETSFINAGYGRVVDGYKDARISFMYNYFVIVGPETDLAGVADVNTAAEAFKAISDYNTANATDIEFISRGDTSGTRGKESNLWKAGLTETNCLTEVLNGTTYYMPKDGTATPAWYVDNNSAMGATLTMANEKSGYCLTDKATFLNYEKQGLVDNLSILFEASNDMMNTYSMIAVDKDASFKDADGNVVTGVAIDEAAADVFVNWMNSVHARYLISTYGKADYDVSLFTNLPIQSEMIDGVVGNNPAA